MNHYYNGVDNSAYLAHYGVLGMKWGQHLFGKDRSSRSSNQSNSTSAKSRVKRATAIGTVLGGPLVGVTAGLVSAKRNGYGKSNQTTNSVVANTPKATTTNITKTSNYKMTDADTWKAIGTRETLGNQYARQQLRRSNYNREQALSDAKTAKSGYNKSLITIGGLSGLGVSAAAVLSGTGPIATAGVLGATAIKTAMDVHSNNKGYKQTVSGLNSMTDKDAATLKKLDEQLAGVIVVKPK
jgi:hypothetical protein